MPRKSPNSKTGIICIHTGLSAVLWKQRTNRKEIGNAASVADDVILVHLAAHSARFDRDEPGGVGKRGKDAGGRKDRKCVDIDPETIFEKGVTVASPY